MAFVRRKLVRGVERCYLVENHRDHGRVRQRMIAYLGPCATVDEAIEFWAAYAKRCRELATTPDARRREAARAERAERRVRFLRQWRNQKQLTGQLPAKVPVGTTRSESKTNMGGAAMAFDPYGMPAVKKALAAMEAANREAWRLEKESLPAAEADLKKAEEAYQNAAAAAWRNSAARPEAAEAERLRDEARRNFDGVRRAAELSKLEGQRLTGEYSGAVSTAKREEAMRLLDEAKAKFREIAARWNQFARAVRELLLIKKALSELGEEGGMPFVSVAQQLNYWAHDRFILAGLPVWDLPEEK
jgi:hypothetical protein